MTKGRRPLVELYFGDALRAMGEREVTIKEVEAPLGGSKQTAESTTLEPFSGDDPKVTGRQLKPPFTFAALDLDKAAGRPLWKPPRRSARHLSAAAPTDGLAGWPRGVARSAAGPARRPPVRRPQPAPTRPD